MPFFYYAYGHSIRSDLALAELKPVPAVAAEVAIEATAFGRPLPAGDEMAFEFGPGRAHLAFGRVGQFEVREDGVIRYELVEGGNPALAGVVLLGTVFAALLQMRGQLVLHASAVAVGGRGVVFLGAKGAGKSSLAAACLRAGHGFLTDDVLPVGAGGELVPGFPQIKLVTPLEGLAGAVPMPEIGKSRLDVGETAAAAPAAVLYVLRGGGALGCEPVTGAAALGAVMGNSYMARFGREFFVGAGAAAHLVQCADLLRVAPVRRLTVPRGLGRLAEVVGFVERDAGLV
jgi:hypothetical protein